MASLPFWQSCAGEFLGMALFLFIAVTVIVFTFPSSAAAPGNDAAAYAASTLPRVAMIAAAFGFSIAVLVFALSTSSGGHLNPAVSGVLWLRGAVSLPRFVCYTGSQMAGACAGAALVKSLNPQLYARLPGAACNRVFYSLADGMTAWTAFGAEMLATSLLCWAVLSSSDVGTIAATRRHGALNPLSIGLAVFVCHLALVPIDGCGINPARSFGTAAVANFFTDQRVNFPRSPQPRALARAPSLARALTNFGPSLPLSPSSFLARAPAAGSSGWRPSRASPSPSSRTSSSSSDGGRCRRRSSRSSRRTRRRPRPRRPAPRTTAAARRSTRTCCLRRRRPPRPRQARM